MHFAPFRGSSQISFSRIWATVPSFCPSSDFIPVSFLWEEHGLLGRRAAVSPNGHQHSCKGKRLPESRKKEKWMDMSNLRGQSHLESDSSQRHQRKGWPWKRKADTSQVSGGTVNSGTRNGSRKREWPARWQAQAAKGKTEAEKMLDGRTVPRKHVMP